MTQDVKEESMAKTQKDQGAKPAGSAAEAKSKAAAKPDLTKKIVLNGADIVQIGPDAELLVGGKNYNTAIISQVAGIRAPQFRAISSNAFHMLLDETKVNAALVRSIVDKEYNATDWNDDEVNRDIEFLRKFTRRIAKRSRPSWPGTPAAHQARTFVNNVVEASPPAPGHRPAAQRSVLVQASFRGAPRRWPTPCAGPTCICKDAGLEDVPVAVRSSAAGEDSCKKAFAGLQDTYLNIVGEDRCVEAYHWDCASAYNLRSMTYRREAILDAVHKAEQTGDDLIAETAKKEWAIENTSLSCASCMINRSSPARRSRRHGHRLPQHGQG
jgi:pyruvate,water dikinase